VGAVANKRASPIPTPPGNVSLRRRASRTLFIGGLLGGAFAATGQPSSSYATAMVVVAVGLGAGGYAVHRESAKGRESPANGWTWSDVALALALGAVVDIATGSALTAVQPAALHLAGTGAGYVLDTLATIAPAAALWFGVVVMLRWRRGLSLAAVGIQPQPRTWLIWILPLAAAAIVGTEAVALATRPMYSDAVNPQCGAIRAAVGGGLALLVLSVVFVPPVLEELLIRGLVFGWLRLHLPAATSALLSAIIWAGLHGIAVLFLPLLALGIGLAYVREKSGSLYPSMLIHGLFNSWNLVFLLASPAC